MESFGTIFVGLIVGALARWVMPGEQKMGWILTILLGIAGSVVAGVIGRGLLVSTGPAGGLDRLGDRSRAAAVHRRQDTRQVIADAALRRLLQAEAELSAVRAGPWRRTSTRCRTRRNCASTSTRRRCPMR